MDRVWLTYGWPGGDKAPFTPLRVADGQDPAPPCPSLPGMSYHKGIIFVVTAAAIWSLMGLMIRQLESADTWQVLLWRSIGAVAVLGAWVTWRSKGRPWARIRGTGWAGVIGGLALVAAFAGAIFAIQSTTVANAVFLFSASPFLAAILGAVVLRADGAVLVVQPKPKHAGEIPPFVLPRGSRQYRNEQGIWVDARDVATGEKYKDSLEPFSRALEREVEEEAGVTPAMLARAEVCELGRMEFQSRSKGVYPIHWFVVTLDEGDAAGAADAVPEDALSVRWATLDEIKAMAARNEFSGGYLEVIEAALSLPH